MTGENDKIYLRTATSADFERLYALGKSTPEFQVSSSGEFMEPDEFRSAIANAEGVMLLAESGSDIAGFIYASWRDVERGPETRWACLVYLVVKGDYRHRGLAQRLYDACIEDLKKHGVNRLYGWAHAGGDGAIIAFLKKQGFQEGHKYVWMQKEL